ncbi:Oligoribonuclease NrnB or cAMP/cGMP phosphodiesterase, DHH superfamily [Methylobacterium sp. UNC378MF]|uniref:dimethylmenaquinone methyltransferase n=1 Tax=Methylobacterium sp. UNC378MF TaxID=1502748 RepID=UPI00088D3C7B|nr:dimethylmenaquinone methyltransferase [Methylobacterium sp. UNC378MF]SDA29701.1 Oligoribonuclease NrnB or cAMP/cGMP phosphodiesterase, DHH superfamily [Methylobacterium sp. UNC378MF]
MRLIQITHHDLDGYGASTVAAACATVERVVHVPRYSDVGPVLEDEIKRLGRAAEREVLLMTDLGLEEQTIAGLKKFAAMNRRREDGQKHRLVVLDHHTSSLDQLRRLGLEPAPDAARPALHRVDLGDPEIAVLIEDDICATRMTFDHRALFATSEPETDLSSLLSAVDAVDLWRKESPAFRGGLALDELFWEVVSSYVPVGHPWHDRFVSDILLAAAAALRDGASPAELERRASVIRTGVVDTLLRDAPDDDPALTTRMRLARALARSDSLFRPLKDGTLLSFALDSGTFQRVSDLIMDAGRAKRVVNVQRMGNLSFRSNDGTALDGARLFRGGGHRDAAGGRLQSGSAFSMTDAIAQVEPVLNPEKPAGSDSPFAALKNWKG